MASAIDRHHLAAVISARIIPHIGGARLGRRIRIVDDHAASGGERVARNRETLGRRLERVAIHVRVPERLQRAPVEGRLAAAGEAAQNDDLELQCGGENKKDQTNMDEIGSDIG